MKVLPEGWEWKKLEDIAEINSRFNKNSFDDGLEVTFLPMRCVEELTGQMDTSIEKKYGEIKTGYTPIQEGDLLFAKITPCIENGKIAIARNLKNGIGFASTEFHTLKFSKEADTKYFFFYLMQEKIRQEAARNMTGTAGQQRVPVTFLKQLKVLVPPLPVQRQIVAVLERAEALKRQRQEADALTGALLQSVFYEMFGDLTKNEREWDIVKLENICTKITDGTHVTPEYIEKGVPFLSVRNLTKGYLDFDDVKYISESEHQYITKRSKPERGDILLTKVGVNYGIAEIVDVDTEFSIFVSLALLKPKFDLVDPYYLKHCINSDFVYRQAQNRISGIGVPDLHLVEIKQFKIPLPPLALQQQFARIVESVERIRERQLASGKEIEGLCEGLMQRAFAGELVSS